MKKSLKKITLKELAAIVGAQLQKHKINAVLTGGACVSIYSANKYQSLDLDFVASGVEDKPAEIRQAMREIGFKLETAGIFERSDCPFFVEFIPPPLAVGREPVKKVVTLKTKQGSFRILSATDCVKDRLAAYYHWKDLQSLEQALLVAERCKVDLKEIKRWSKVEDYLEKCEEFLKKLRAKR